MKATLFAVGCMPLLDAEWSATRYADLSITTQAACPRTLSPPFNIEGEGVHPEARRLLNISSALGSWPHTATAVTPPSQVVS